MPPPTQPGGLGAAAATAAASVTDRLFGTRTVTSGASRQLPRKTPLRIEPKTFFGEMGGETSGDRHGVCVGGGALVAHEIWHAEKMRTTPRAARGEPSRPRHWGRPAEAAALGGVLARQA